MFVVWDNHQALKTFSCRSTLEESSDCSLMNSRSSAVLMMTQSSFGTFWTCQCQKARDPRPEPTPMSRNERPAVFCLFFSSLQHVLVGSVLAQARKSPSHKRHLGGLTLLGGGFRAWLGFDKVFIGLAWAQGLHASLLTLEDTVTARDEQW